MVLDGNAVRSVDRAAALLLALGPLVTGYVQKLKAALQCRRGASVLQPYRDLRKLLSKGSVRSDTASGLFRTVPVLVLSASAAAGMIARTTPITGKMSQAAATNASGTTAGTPSTARTIAVYTANAADTTACPRTNA